MTIRRILKRRPDYARQNVALYCADSLITMPQLARHSVDAVITSPPYAMQRSLLYGGINVEQYPAWTVQWMQASSASMRKRGSWLINIREHIVSGAMSDYVHRTRLAVRDAAFVECDEIIWVKPDAPPIGHPKRPRRSWERILWFAKTGDSYCNPRGNGQFSQRLGMPKSQVGRASLAWLGDSRDSFSSGTARHRDYVVCGVGKSGKHNLHPARYPVALPEWLMRGWCPVSGFVLDPFMGSGSTGVACVQTGRGFIGIEISRKYFDMAVRHIDDALNIGHLFLPDGMPVNRAI